jgi:RNA methyltransferase, TrmH family
MTFKHIISRDNSIYKSLRKLADSSRERAKAGQTLLDGIHLLESYMDTFGEPKLIVIPEGQSTDEVNHFLMNHPDIPTLLIPTLMFKDISPVASPTGIIALIDIPKITPPVNQALVLMIEDIQDPGNLGSMLRTAAAAGVDCVYLSKACTDAFSPKALRGGQGSQFICPIEQNVDLVEVVKSFQGKVFATCMQGDSIFKTTLTGNVAILIGNEGRGLSEALLSVATHQITIPMVGVESLNAAAATAVSLFECVRQRLVAGF